MTAESLTTPEIWAALEMVNGESRAEHTNPQPLPCELPPVKPFDYELLPDSFRPWITDNCERVQCPPDYVAVAAIAAAGSLIGRKVAVRPQRRTDWYEIPNLWALLVGRPSTMKSPAMSAALAPLHRLAALATADYEAAMQSHKATLLQAEMVADAAKKNAKTMIEKAMKSGGSLPDVSHLLGDDNDVEAPTLRRYMVNDSSHQALGELLRQNPNGIAVVRDEIIGLLRTFEREDGTEARAFYLEGADGKNSFTFDRIGRGLNLHVPAVCLTLIGATQPAKIARFLRGAVNGDENDDGLVQRFRLMVWPDDDGRPWRDVDRLPDTTAKNSAFEVFQRLDTFTAADVQAEHDLYDEDALPFLRFDPHAAEMFLEWRTALENELRGKTLPDAVESHLAKYRKLVPCLALILHLSDGGTGPISSTATARALDWSEYLRSHAERAYSSVTMPTIGTAKRIANAIAKGDLHGTVSITEIRRKRYGGTDDASKVREALELLVDHDWLTIERIERTAGAGRPAEVCIINPLARAG
jgi:putative DNA primase/helicase